jgi:uncharacterized protein YbaR (Trm112 family)
MNDFGREAVEERTRSWLDTAYLRGVMAMRERPPVFDAGGRPQRMTPYDFQELQRKLEVFRWFDRFDFASFLDVGSGFDVVPQLVSRRYGVPGYYADLVHTMNLPYGGDALGRLDRAVTVNVARLPFPDGAFDLVLASEVLEHLVRPVEAIAELLRVSRRYLVMTSLEALAVGRWQRCWAHHRVDVRVPHDERNFFLLAEFAALFGSDFHHENLFYGPALPANPLLPQAEQAAAYARLTDLAVLEEALHAATAVRDHRPGAMGILLVKAAPGAAVRPAAARPDLARWLIDEKIRLERTWQRLLADMDAGRGEFPPRERPIATDLLARVVCPDCRGTFERAGSGLTCTACGARFAGEHGVPILYPTRARDEREVVEESLDRLCGDDRRRRWTVRRLLARLRRNERPAGPVRRWLWRLERAAGVVP